MQRAESQARVLHFTVGQQPDQRFVVQIANLDPIAKRIVKIAPKLFVQLEAVFIHHFFPHFRDLLFVPHHDAKMPHPAALQFLHLKDSQELMFAQFEKRIPLPGIEFPQIEDVLVKLDRFFHIIDLDCNVITAKNLNAHICNKKIVSRSLAALGQKPSKRGKNLRLSEEQSQDASK
jgi:hypothetical protein